MAEQRSNELDAFQEWYSANPPSTYRNDWQFARACWVAAAEQAAQAAGERDALKQQLQDAVASLAKIRVKCRELKTSDAEDRNYQYQEGAWAAATAVEESMQGLPSPVAGGPGGAEIDRSAK